MVATNHELRRRRLAAQKTQEQIEDETGVSQALLSNLEHGHCPESVAKALRLARSLGASVEDLFGHLVDGRPMRRKRRSGERVFSVPHHEDLATG
jgi:transcriptional regulator with XRE-family HTH domain